MLIKEKAGNISSVSATKAEIDLLPIEWFETNKRIQHKQTRQGKNISLRFLGENPDLKEGDILWSDEHTIIVVEIIPCECIIITPGNLMSASSVSYEIGNRHLPLYIEENDLLVPFDLPLYNLLLAQSYQVAAGTRKLNHLLKTTVLPHLQISDGVVVNEIYKLSTIS
jgi:urease accessory protein